MFLGPKSKMEDARGRKKDARIYLEDARGVRGYKKVFRGSNFKNQGTSR